MYPSLNNSGNISGQFNSVMNSQQQKQQLEDESYEGEEHLYPKLSPTMQRPFTESNQYLTAHLTPSYVYNPVSTDYSSQQPNFSNSAQMSYGDYSTYGYQQHQNYQTPTPEPQPNQFISQYDSPPSYFDQNFSDLKPSVGISQNKWTQKQQHQGTKEQVKEEKKYEEDAKKLDEQDEKELEEEEEGEEEEEAEQPEESSKTDRQQESAAREMARRLKQIVRLSNRLNESMNARNKHGAIRNSIQLQKEISFAKKSYWNDGVCREVVGLAERALFQFNSSFQEVIREMDSEKAVQSAQLKQYLNAFTQDIAQSTNTSALDSQLQSQQSKSSHLVSQLNKQSQQNQ